MPLQTKSNVQILYTSYSADCTTVLRFFALAIMDAASSTEHLLLAKTVANGTTCQKQQQIKKWHENVSMS